jgi:hypothetical protein
VLGAQRCGSLAVPSSPLGVGWTPDEETEDVEGMKTRVLTVEGRTTGGEHSERND